MDAITGFAAGCIMVVLALVEAAFHLLVILIELLFVVCTKGRSEAMERFQSRRQREREVTKGEAMFRRSLAMAVAGIICVLAFAVWSHYGNIQAERIKATEIQIARLADEFHDRIKDGKRPKPKSGLLDERDAWDQPIEFSVDEFTLGRQILVRSAGRDRKMGTDDDLSATRCVNPTKKDVAGVVVKIGLRAARARIKKMLEEKEEK